MVNLFLYNAIIDQVQTNNKSDFHLKTLSLLCLLCVLCITVACGYSRAQAKLLGVHSQANA